MKLIEKKKKKLAKGIKNEVKELLEKRELDLAAKVEENKDVIK